MTDNADLIAWAKTLGDPDFTLSVPGHAKTAFLSLAAALEASDTRLWEAEAVIERARGWAEQPISGFTPENQMAEVADALAAYKTTKTEGDES